MLNLDALITNWQYILELIEIDSDMCNLNVLGDEYHFFFECVKPDIVSLRQQCIPRYYLQSPSMFKLIQLLKSSDDVKIGKRISMFIQKC